MRSLVWCLVALAAVSISGEGVGDAGETVVQLDDALPMSVRMVTLARLHCLPIAEIPFVAVPDDAQASGSACASGGENRRTRGGDGADDGARQVRVQGALLEHGIQGQLPGGAVSGDDFRKVSEITWAEELQILSAACPQRRPHSV